jgi:hypothetical protein
LRRVAGLAIEPDAAGLGQDEPDSGKLASQKHVGWSRRAAAGDSGQPDRIAALWAPARLQEASRR